MPRQPQDAAARRRKGLFWPVLLVGLLAANVVFDVALIMVASSDRSFAVEPDFYRKALEWDRTQAQEGENRRLGWSLEIALAPARTPGFVGALVHLRDRDGAPVEGARLTADVFHNARAAEVLPASFRSEAGGSYRVELPLRRAGLWEFRLRAERGVEVFTTVVTRELGR